KSAKQSIFATSSAEAEYIAAFDTSNEAVWVRKFISALGVVLTIEEPISMYCDNTGAIAIANESGITKGARHFRDKVHYLREVIEYGDVKLEKVHTDDNLADPFTKALAFSKHSEHTRNIRMLPTSSLMNVSHGKCARKNGKKPKPVDNEECENSKQGEKRGIDPPIKPHGSDSSRMKVILDKESLEVHWFSFGRFLDEDFAGSSCFFSDIEPTRGC
nr:hypothetical protein [Tanacetum cinerariifolium]